MLFTSNAFIISFSLLFKATNERNEKLPSYAQNIPNLGIISYKHLISIFNKILKKVEIPTDWKLPDTIPLRLKIIVQLAFLQQLKNFLNLFIHNRIKTFPKFQQPRVDAGFRKN